MFIYKTSLSFVLLPELLIFSFVSVYQYLSLSFQAFFFFFFFFFFFRTFVLNGFFSLYHSTLKYGSWLDSICKEKFFFLLSIFLLDSFSLSNYIIQVYLCAICSDLSTFMSNWQRSIQIYNSNTYNLYQ